MEKTINYKKLSIHTLIIVAIILLAAISLQSGFAATTTIDNTTSGGISGALNSSAPGDIIELDEGTYTGNNNTNMTINKNITIQGETKDKVILDAQGLTRIYTISGNLNVTFINITFINAIFNGSGGAIYNSNYGTTMEFINCIFRNNTATAGSAIYNNGPNLKVYYSDFINNNASSSSGTVFNNGINTYIGSSNFINNSGGAIYSIANNLIIFSSKFIDNTISTNGAAIISSAANLTVFSSNFTNNLALSGGAISSSGANLTIIDSNFDNNIVSNSGGAISSSGANLTIVGSNFDNNAALSGSGGAISCSGANLTIVGSNFDNNSALSGSGGAIASNAVNFTLVNSNFINNVANEGGAIRNGASGLMNIFSSNFTSNNVNINGGGVIYNNGSLIMDNTKIINNNCNSLTNSGNATAVLEASIISNNSDQESILTINSSVSGRVVTVNVKATDISGNVLVGATVNFYVGGVLVGTGITDSDGVVQFIYTATKAGTNDILAVMDEFSVIDVDDNEFIYSTVSNTTSVDVAKFNTNVTIVVSNATAGKQTIVRGVLVDENGNPISGASLNVVIGGKSYSVVTGADGTWELLYTPSKAGNYNAKVYYNGDNLYLASTGSVAYTVAQEEFGIPQVPNIRLVKRNNSKAVRHGNVVYMKWLTFKNFGASGSQTINAKIIIKNLKYKLWKVYNKKLNYKFAKNNIKFKLNLKSNGAFKLKLKVYRPIR